MTITEVDRWEEAGEELPLPDEGQCQLAIVCTGTLIGVRIGDGDIGDSFTPYTVLHMPGESAHILACEDCAGWLHEVYAPPKTVWVIEREVDGDRVSYDVDVDLGVYLTREAAEAKVAHLTDAGERGKAEQIEEKFTAALAAYERAKQQYDVLDAAGLRPPIVPLEPLRKFIHLPYLQFPRYRVWDEPITVHDG